MPGLNGSRSTAPAAPADRMAPMMSAQMAKDMPLTNQSLLKFEG
jgi:hypothetical protein